MCGLGFEIRFSILPPLMDATDRQPFGKAPNVGHSWVFEPLLVPAGLLSMG